MTDSMMLEQRRRILWAQTVYAFVQTLASTPNPYVATWPDIKDYYKDGLTPREAAIKYLNATHQGENS